MSDDIVVKASTGQRLAEGDSAQVTKDLKIKAPMFCTAAPVSKRSA